MKLSLLTDDTVGRVMERYQIKDERKSPPALSDGIHV